MREPSTHWMEYASEGCCLALFMVSATAFALLLQHPQSPLAGWTASAFTKRAAMGVAMGLTAAALIYSPIGRRSGAHMNPAVTLSFYRLGKIKGIDAVGYVIAQFAGGALGIAAAILLFGHAPAAVNYVATMPGPAGTTAAFAGETVISFVLMVTVLTVSNAPRYAPFTGAAASLLVAIFIAIEAPLSGMSMNPARSLGSALFAHSEALWIYFSAPPLGMLGATEVVVRLAGVARVRCAKLHHVAGDRCIFHCGYMETAA